jgi:iron complex transport system substrate-binding protein
MSLTDVFIAIRQVGEATGTSRRADQVVKRLSARVAAVAERTASLASRPRVTLLEWLDPPFSCGHWNPELVRLAGGIEGLGREGQPSRTLTWDEVLRFSPESVLIACCGYSIERTLRDLPLLVLDPGLREMPAVRSGRVFVADGTQHFSRPGPRLVESLEILANALHPHVHSLPEGVPAALPVEFPVERSSRILNLG